VSTLANSPGKAIKAGQGFQARKARPYKFQASKKKFPSRGQKKNLKIPRAKAKKNMLGLGCNIHKYAAKSKKVYEL
jgi:hypothetical protein